MKKALEDLRAQLNSMIASKEFTTEEILVTSQELDKLIVSYYKLNDEFTSSSITQK
jgi:Spo0E like sporulation regulatory protein.